MYPTVACRDVFLRTHGQQPSEKRLLSLFTCCAHFARHPAAHSEANQKSYWKEYNKCGRLTRRERLLTVPHVHYFQFLLLYLEGEYQTYLLQIEPTPIKATVGARNVARMRATRRENIVRFPVCTAILTVTSQFRRRSSIGGQDFDTSSTCNSSSILIGYQDMPRIFTTSRNTPLDASNNVYGL